MDKSIKPYLLHILEECEFLINTSKDLSYSDFIKDPVFKRAFVRSLEIIGEAAKNIDPPFKSNHPEIPWKLMAGMRDKLVHEYFGVNYMVVWETVKEDIVKLYKEIKKLILLSDTQIRD